MTSSSVSLCFICLLQTEELEINAGLQDRVVQVYGGLVSMDFNHQQMKNHGHGIYEQLDSDILRGESHTQT